MHACDCRVLVLYHIDTLTKSNIKIDKIDLPTFYWLPKLHKNPYKSRSISNFNLCSTTILSKHITSALTAVKDHVIKYSETAFSNSNVNYFYPSKSLMRSSKSCGCETFRVLKYLLSIFLLYTHFYSNKKYVTYTCLTCTELCESYIFLIENIYVQFDDLLYQQIVGFPMGTTCNCAPLIADLFLYCHERGFSQTSRNPNGLTS